MGVKLSVVVAVSLKNATTEIKSDDMGSGLNRISFVKMLCFYNRDLNEYVSNEYLNELWEKVVNNEFFMSYANWCSTFPNKVKSYKPSHFGVETVKH